MTKDEVLSGLHALIDTRVFGDQWLITWETGAAVTAKITELGLDSTPLNRSAEIDMELMMMFVGCWHQWEAVNILEEYGFINQEEYDYLADRIAKNEEDENREPDCHGSDLDAAFMPFVRRAYFQYFNPSRRLS